ncbi:MAG: aspartate/glutamate racemase family protein [Roseburia sp.]
MRLGIIGGLGPMATAYFMELIVAMTDASKDQDHIETIIYSIPTVPDRTAYILGQSEENPVKDMIEIGKALCSQGAEVLAIPCITAHYFHSQLQDGIGMPVIHGIRKTAEALKQAGITCAGVMATDGTVCSGLFQQEFSLAGIRTVVPSEEGQEAVMSLIYNDIKANRKPDMKRFMQVVTELKEQGAECVVLGCTELSLIKKEYEIGSGFVDVMEVLAQQTILACGKNVATDYQNLVSRF